MARESKDQKKVRVNRVISILQELYPNAKTALNHNNAFELLIATILSAQCTDERVNKVTPALFQAAPNPQTMVAIGENRVRKLIASINFFNNKARNIILCCESLLNDFGGEVPSRLEDLIKLAGVGRKTANVVLGDAFGKPEGVVVDTHVFRLSHRLRLAGGSTAEKVENELNELVTPTHWTLISHLLILHGRARCRARTPDCQSCEIIKHCPTGSRLAKAEL